MPRMLFLMLLLATAQAASGCTTRAPADQPRRSGPAGPVSLTQAERSLVERETLAALPEIASGTFRTISAARAADGKVTVCGYLDFDDGRGVRSGDKPFVGLLAGDAFTLSALGGTAEETAAVQAECIRNRVYI